MYSDIVLEFHMRILKNYLKQKNFLMADSDTELEQKNMKSLVNKYKDLVKSSTKVDFPDPKSQLWGLYLRYLIVGEIKEQLL